MNAAGEYRLEPGKGASARRSLVALAVVLLTLLLPALAQAEPGDLIESFGPDGTEGTEFPTPATLGVDQGTGAVYVGDRDEQALYKFDADGNPVNFTGSAGYISGHRITGLAFNAGNPGEAQVAVDSETHVIYVTSADKVRAFEQNGEPHEFTAGPGAGSTEIPGATDLLGVAVDENGTIYASDWASKKVRIYSRSGALLTVVEPKNTVSPLSPANLAVAPDGSLYVTNYFSFPVYKLEPSQFPVTSETTYSVGKALDGGKAFSVAISPTTSYVYVGEVSPFRVLVYDDESGKLVGSIGAPGQSGEFKGPPVGVGVIGTAERAYVAVNAETGADPSQVEIFSSLSFPVGRPTVSDTSATEVTLNSAKLRGKVNPNTLATSYHFEYGLQDCAVSVCTSVPVPDIAIGEGHENVIISREIFGLEPGTTYHYRIVAENAEGITEGPGNTFTTELGSLGFDLADMRAWELVSPPDKSGGRLLRYNQGVLQAAADGNGVAYQSVTSIEPDPEGNRAIDFSTVLSRRGAGGSWSSRDISPPHQEVAPLRFGGEYKSFSPDLGLATLEQQDYTPLSPRASEETPYLRTNTEPPEYTPLLTGKEPYANVPPGTVFGGEGLSGQPVVGLEAGNRDLTHLVLRSHAPLVAGAQPESLYLWNDGLLQPVSKLPVGEGGDVIRGTAGSGHTSVSGAVSEDGSRIFWQSDAIGFADHLYVRDTINGVTGRLDVAQPPSGAGEADPLFQAASSDGKVVFFTDSRQLTVDASAPGGSPGNRTRDLYRCEVAPLEGGALGCATLSDISAPLNGSGERAEVLGLAPAVNEDGTRAYLVARGVLDTAPNEAGDTAAAGEQNLYLWEAGHGRRFIARLSEADQTDWGLVPVANAYEPVTARLSANSSADGRYFAFMSERSLTGYENRDAVSDEPLEEIFRYDALTGSLDCISCNPSGASPEGELSNPDADAPPEVDPGNLWQQRWLAAALPAAQESEPAQGVTFYRPRVVLDNGRIFFTAIDSLVRADSNGEWDVYQWEPVGVGDCTVAPGSTAVARSAGGCVSLLTSGTGAEEASFLDASVTGDDVFVLTPARLSVTDEDEELDVYDVRVNGTPATTQPSTECLGEACQPAATSPNDATPASAAFVGPGNLHPRAKGSCAKGKKAVRRKGHRRCLPRHGRRHHKHRRAHREGRVHR